VNIKCNYKGNNIPCGKAVAPGTVASLECKVSYQLTFEPGYNKITCQEDGKWDKPLFTCTQGQISSKWFLIFPKIKITVQTLNITVFYHPSNTLAL
jgi:hypothetical protein